MLSIQMWFGRALAWRKEAPLVLRLRKMEKPNIPQQKSLGSSWGLRLIVSCWWLKWICLSARRRILWRKLFPCSRLFIRKEMLIEAGIWLLVLGAHSSVPLLWSSHSFFPLFDSRTISFIWLSLCLFLWSQGLAHKAFDSTFFINYINKILNYIRVNIIQNLLFVLFVNFILLIIIYVLGLFVLIIFFVALDSK